MRHAPAWGMTGLAWTVPSGMGVQHPMMESGTAIAQRRGFMEFDSDWITLGKHRVRLRCMRGFPTEKTRTVAEVARIAIEHNLSAAARLVEVWSDGGNAYTISIGTTFPKDKDAAPHLE